jgi:hypothetical protein
MKNITETVSHYVNGWNEKTPEAVKAEFIKCLDAGITYTDKNTALVNGIDDFIKLVMSSHEKVTGRTFSVLTTPEYFDHYCYYTWGINIPGKGEFAGHDYFEYNEEGLITRIIGFVPAL